MRNEQMDGCKMLRWVVLMRASWAAGVNDIATHVVSDFNLTHNHFHQKFRCYMFTTPTTIADVGK